MRPIAGRSCVRDRSFHTVRRPRSREDNRGRRRSCVTRRGYLARPEKSAGDSDNLAARTVGVRGASLQFGRYRPSTVSMVPCETGRQTGARRSSACAGAAVTHRNAGADLRAAQSAACGTGRLTMPQADTPAARGRSGSSWAAVRTDLARAEPSSHTRAAASEPLSSVIKHSAQTPRLLPASAPPDKPGFIWTF